MSSSGKLQHLYCPGIALCGSVRDITYLSNTINELRGKSALANVYVPKTGMLNEARGNVLKINFGGQRCKCQNCRVFGSKPANCFNFLDNEIFFEPTEKLYDGSEPWMWLPPELILGHEFVHAYRLADGLSLSTTDKLVEEYATVGIPPFASEDGFTENGMRKEYGLPMRPRY